MIYQTAFNLDGISVTRLVEPYLNVVLEDDDTPTGGTAFQGETVGDFIQSVGTELNNCTLEQLNAALIECGIKPVLSN